MARTTTTPVRGTDDQIAERITDLQKVRRELLEQTADMLRSIEGEIDNLAAALTVRASTTPARAASVSKAILSRRVNLGELSSRLWDAMERNGVEPVQAPAHRPRWALVTN